MVPGEPGEGTRQPLEGVGLDEVVVGRDAVDQVGPAGAAASGTAGVTNDAVSALVNLGYRRADAFTAVAAAVQKAGPDAKVEQLIMMGLKELSA